MLRHGHPRHTWLQPARARVAARCAPAAFTLLEVCVALAIASLVLGVAVLGISGVNEEHALRRMASLIESTAREGLVAAVTQRREVHLRIEQNAIALPEAGEAARQTFAGTLELRRHGEPSFRAPRHGETWSFLPDGLCEPLEVRVTNAHGVIELAFDPLTAVASRKSVIVRNP